ncbi:delta-60 repeat domain-containing protein/Por secretion system C-terminal sorting domain-containing protein [Hymenobacter daecheongensis DSM 21074]|uniref:Delta-60 repeat domain-containing protein/Por secretion system C-terminal sorting domain-containing protein n=1 Tax=Hymenobacter daecheongensis DSM 21074 TaxID=1121955 RepID=A0A1M6K014_9BACT|nr:T9SS type A sorting domain-containing protein [Hymenobacter daecheongensis]SHJ52224.1 delta-60 repeat domain-containing protein/Por secretion system C-terminal sorting domain-containing protein [Hymenobacter daecheongensis DSM 21074]
MKKLQLLISGLCLVPLLWQPVAAQTLDPTFTRPTLYAPAAITSVTEQPDGKRLVLGTFLRLNGTMATRVARLNANGTLDAAFSQNVGNSSLMARAYLQSDGKYLLLSYSFGAISIGGITRSGSLIRLNADGTGDTSFDVGSGGASTTGSYLDDALPLPNGQTLVVGKFDEFSGTPAHSIVRLNANGSVDASFNQGAGADDEVESVVPVAGGKFLIGGYFTTYNGITCNGLARLNADGSFDSSFNAGLLPSSDIINLKVQPDGKILLAGNIVSAAYPMGVSMVRVQPDGALDNSFTAPTPLANPYEVYSYYGQVMEVQADGKIYVKLNTRASSVVRLNPNGSLDPSFASIGDANYAPYSITLLNNGKLAVAGFFTNFSGALDRTLLQLNQNGTVDPSFQPVAQASGSILAMARQPDGKLLIGGSFSEINGQPVRRLARLNADGTLDASFNASTSLDLNVGTLALQPNGSVLAAAGSVARRFLPTGAPDNTFSISPLTGTLTRVLVQTDGKILLGGSFSSYNGTPAAGIVRLTSLGAYDPTFVPSTFGLNSLASFHDMVLQPNGQLLVGGYFRPSSGSSNVLRVFRYTPTGGIEPTFTSPAFTSASSTTNPNLRLNALTLQPDGKLVAGGYFEAVNGTPRANLARLNADGTLDTGFTPPTVTGTLYSLTVQPNNRILVGGSFSGAGLPSNLARVLPNGAADASFAATAVPNNIVRSMLVQPDGAIVVGGSFGTISGTATGALARITAPNVLHIAAPRAVAERTAAWPVPAHGTLHVAPDATAHAQSLELLDALGRPVRHQALTGAAATTLPLDKLAAGTYLLRVNYTEGTVVRRIQVQ